MAILRDTNKRIQGPIKKLVGPLKAGAKEKNKFNETIEHDLIIGKPIRSIIKTKSRKTRRISTIHFPTLNEYCLFVSRVKAPIYPKDASTIISLLDIGPYSRIMEAGTGNASLTLHLAQSLYPTGQLHSIDVDPIASARARETVANFSRGIYSDVIKFSTGTCPKVLEDDPHLYDGVVLDLPEPSSELPAVVSKLKIDRFVVCYLPNMNQVLALFQYVRAQKLPLELEKVLEVQWRPWDVKATVIRSKMGSEPFSVKQLINSNKIPDEATGYICRPSHEPTAHTAFLMCMEKIDQNSLQGTIAKEDTEDTSQ